MINNCVIGGRLTADPSLRYTNNGNAVANFTLAIDRPFKQQNGESETDFIDVVVWRKTAESVANHLAKGCRAIAQGRMQKRSYEANDGSTRWVTEVVADNVRFIDFADSKNESSDSFDNDDGVPF